MDKRIERISLIGSAATIFAVGHYALEPLGLPHGSAELALESLAASALLFKDQIAFRIASGRQKIISLLASKQK